MSLSLFRDSTCSILPGSSHCTGLITGSETFSGPQLYISGNVSLPVISPLRDWADGIPNTPEPISLKKIFTIVAAGDITGTLCTQWTMVCCLLRELSRSRYSRMLQPFKLLFYSVRKDNHRLSCVGVHRALYSEAGQTQKTGL